ncbi:MAG: patatin-like phospholipase family protein, partial [Proteobacteria bacterium]|nr:patatin-like phospholipase family protein [Pseudomonadota bacterium]
MPVRSSGRSLCRTGLTVVLLIIANLALSSCGALTIRDPLPEQYVQEAQIKDMPFARFWGDEMPSDWQERLIELKKHFSAIDQDVKEKTVNYLAISGGGANGAFGAGLLAGWTAAGNRPEFAIVTGVSTGALIAPFAFLGPEQDAQLKKFYTTTSTEDIITKRTIMSILRGESINDSEPLRDTLTSTFDQQMLAAIAAEHARGRRLFVGTTNLDAGRPVIWDIGAIAASNHPRAAELVVDILLASASIPGIFPAIFFEIEAGGEEYDEMHVDGGTSSQMFLYPAPLDAQKIDEIIGMKGTYRLFLIRNARLKAEWKAVKPRVGRIAIRSVSTLVRAQGMGDLYRIYLRTQRDGIDYNLAYIPEDFTLKSKELFDPEYMGQLFDLGYQMAQDGYPWQKG